MALRYIFLAVFLTVVTGAILWKFGGTNDPGFADANDPELVALGSSIYGAHCAACHGADLKGQPDWHKRGPDGKLPAPPHDETGHTWHHSDAQNFKVTKLGTEALAPPGYKSDMKGFDDILSDREIWAALAYIKSRWPAKIRDRHDSMNAQKQ
ncbi:MAG: cytochrome c [Proteobacteria bacterium]|nr:cytochrome c [Pseudomonadota bacterium]